MEIRIPLEEIDRERRLLEEERDTLMRAAADLRELMREGAGPGSSREGGDSGFGMSRATAEKLDGILGELDEECRGISAMSVFLQTVSRIYRHAEESVTDRYNLEDREYPGTVFGTSHFETLGGFMYLLEKRQ